MTRPRMSYFMYVSTFLATKYTHTHTHTSVVISVVVYDSVTNPKPAPHYLPLEGLTSSISMTGKWCHICQTHGNGEQLAELEVRNELIVESN